MKEKDHSHPSSSDPASYPGSENTEWYVVVHITFEFDKGQAVRGVGQAVVSVG